MSKETDLIFIREAINFLELVNSKHGVLPHTTIMRIKNVIGELENILEEER